MESLLTATDKVKIAASFYVCNNCQPKLCFDFGTHKCTHFAYYLYNWTREPVEVWTVSLQHTGAPHMHISSWDAGLHRSTKPVAFQHLGLLSSRIQNLSTWQCYVSGSVGILCEISMSWGNDWMTVNGQASSRWSLIKRFCIVLLFHMFYYFIQCFI